MKNNFTLWCLSCCLMSAASMAQQKNVIMYIGDGFGLAPKTAARMAMGQGQNGKRFENDANFHVLALDHLKYNATVTTHSLNSWITDSAPGASVYACGVAGKVDNEVLSLNPTTLNPIETILEAAKKKGYAVGLVTSTRVTHATPAAFGSHIWLRDLESYIALQYVTSTEAEYEAVLNGSSVTSAHYDATRDWMLPSTKVGVEIDVILGGGSRFFLPKSTVSPNAAVVDKNGVQIVDGNAANVTFGKGSRADEVDLIDWAKTNKNYKYVNSRDALMNLDLTQFTPTSTNKLLGLFNNSHASYEQDRQQFFNWEPSLADMTQIAIEVLKRKGGTKGFFLIVEGGRIDHLAHANSGGITVVTGSPNQYTISADKEVYLNANGKPNGESIYAATPTTATNTNIYGSDYMIKEVMAFDYAVAEGRSFLNNSSNGNTLIMSSSDHECGGVALVGLHDELDAQNNGTKIRTYAKAVSQPNPTSATPMGVVRGDGGDNGWYPEYVTYTANDGRIFPMPASATAKRIVIAYGSNPVTNGNGTNAANGTTGGGTPGNHTPQDIWVGAEDNTGTHANQIAGRGLMDNTSLHPIMYDFLQLGVVTPINVAEQRSSDELNSIVYPVPFSSQATIGFDLKSSALVSIDLYDTQGLFVKSITENKSFSSGYQEVLFSASDLKQGTYIAVIKANGTQVTKKVVKL